MMSNIGCRSCGELAMTRSTSEIAALCLATSVNSLCSSSERAGARLRRLLDRWMVFWCGRSCFIVFAAVHRERRVVVRFCFGQGYHNGSDRRPRCLPWRWCNPVQPFGVSSGARCSRVHRSRHACICVFGNPAPQLSIGHKRKITRNAVAPASTTKPQQIATAYA